MFSNRKAANIIKGWLAPYHIECRDGRAGSRSVWGTWMSATIALRRAANALRDVSSSTLRINWR